MPIPPAIPFGGLAGFRFLERTYQSQIATFSQSPDVDRELAHFLEKAPEMTSVDALMGDRRVLAVVLGAFGLDEDLDKGAFIRKVIEEGTSERTAFANRLVDPAYREMAEFVGFGDFGGTLVFQNTQLNIVDRYRERQFELAVGEQDLNMRLALNFKRESIEIAGSSSTTDTMWLRLLGSQPIRAVIEGALFLPQTFALIDLDQQVEEVKSRAEKLFGTADPTIFQSTENLDRMVERFLLRQETLGGGFSASTRGSAALTILQSNTLGAEAQQNLFASNFL